MNLPETLRPVVLDGQFRSTHDLMMLPVEAIKPRVQCNLRPVNELHVEELLDSIDAIGLICPIATDRHHRLVAGAHRLEAVRRLHAARRWPGPVPVRVFVDLDSEIDPGTARIVEVAENDKRRDYTAAEIRSLADWLRLRGYSQGGRGRPSKLEKPLVPALSVMVGKSQRRLQQILSGRPEPEEELALALRSLARASEKAGKALEGDRRAVAVELRRLLDKLPSLVARVR